MLLRPWASNSEESPRWWGSSGATAGRVEQWAAAVGGGGGRSGRQPLHAEGDCLDHARAADSSAGPHRDLARAARSRPS